jgi:hypothetical protein
MIVVGFARAGSLSCLVGLHVAALVALHWWMVRDDG